jgi:hypothetical protein
MSEPPPTVSDNTDSSSVVAEFAYAIPAGIVIAMSLVFTLMAASVLVPALIASASRNLDLGLIAVGVGVTATIGAARLWARRSWLILAIPAVLLPVGATIAWQYALRNWGA